MVFFPFKFWICIGRKSNAFESKIQIPHINPIIIDTLFSIEWIMIIMYLWWLNFIKHNFVFIYCDSILWSLICSYIFFIFFSLFLGSSLKNMIIYVYFRAILFIIFVACRSISFDLTTNWNSNKQKSNSVGTKAFFLWNAHKQCMEMFTLQKCIYSKYVAEKNTVDLNFKDEFKLISESKIFWEKKMNDWLIVWLLVSFLLLKVDIWWFWWCFYSYL